MCYEWVAPLSLSPHLQRRLGRCFMPCTSSEICRRTANLRARCKNMTQITPVVSIAVYPAGGRGLISNSRWMITNTHTSICVDFGCMRWAQTSKRSMRRLPECCSAFDWMQKYFWLHESLAHVHYSFFQGSCITGKTWHPSSNFVIYAKPILIKCQIRFEIITRIQIKN